MINAPVFSDYLNEYQSIGIGQLIYDLIYRTVERTVHRYPPSVYSKNQAWDEDAISGICHDFIIEKLLIKGWLDFYLFSLSEIDGLKRVLKRDFRHYLINKKAHTEKTNLYLRVKKILNTSTRFTTLQENGTRGVFWGLTGWDRRSVTQDPYEVTKAMILVQLPDMIRYRPDSHKVSPLLSNPDLTQMIEGALFFLDKWTTFDVLFDSICNRLGIITDEVISFDEPIGEDTGSTFADIIADPENSIETDLSAKQTAEDIYNRLSDRQREVLALQFELQNPTLVDIGEKIGVSKSTVSNEMSAIERIIRNSHPSQLEVDDVFLALKEIFAANTHRSILDTKREF